MAAARADIVRFASLLRQHLSQGTGRPVAKSGRSPRWSAGVFAEACNVTPQSVANWTQARNLPTDQSFIAICSVLFQNVPNWRDHEPFVVLDEAYWDATRRGLLPSDVPESGTRSLTPGRVLPPQSAGPHFAVNPTGKIAHSPPKDIDEKNNNISRIEKLLPLVREDIQKFSAHFPDGSNAFAGLISDVKRYQAEVGRTLQEIDWGLVWGLGVRLEEAAIAAQRQVDRMSPSLEDAALSSLNALRTVHSTLILATAEGRELQEQADRLKMSHAEQTEFQRNARELSSNLMQDESVIEISASKILKEAVDSIAGDRHPERGTMFGIATIKHSAIVLIGAALVAGSATAVTVTIGSASGSIMTMGLWEIMKKSPVYSSATSALGEYFSELLQAGGEKTQELLSKLAPFRTFVLRNQAGLRHIAQSTSQLSWMVEYIDYIAATQPKDLTDSVS